MLLRLVAGLFGAVCLVSALQFLKGGGTFTQQLADGRSLVRAPNRTERIGFALMFVLFGAWLLAYAVLPTGDRVAVELYAGAALTLAFCLVTVAMVVKLPSDAIALSQGAIVEPEGNDTTIEIPTPSDAIGGLVNRAMPATWRKGQAVVLALIVAVGCVLILAGLMPEGVVDWLENADATITELDLAVTGAGLALVVAGCAIAIVIGVLSWNLGLAGGAAAILVILAALLGLGALVGGTQDLWDATRGIVT
jgi:hypothetical protein